MATASARNPVGQPVASPRSATEATETPSSRPISVSAASADTSHGREVYGKNCAACHDRLDPMGFALENFDAIGRFHAKDGDVVYVKESLF